MSRPRSENPKEHVSLVCSKQKNGWYYVLEVTSVYDPKIKNSRKIRSRLVGKLPPGETDLNKMIPTEPGQGRKKKTIPQALTELKDSRNPLYVVYPLDLTLLVVVLAAMAGYTSCYQIAQYWASNRTVLKKYFDDFPDWDISHDTVRRLIKLIGKQQSEQLIRRFTEQLLNLIKHRVVSLDGQSVKASKTLLQPRGQYVLNVYDSDDQLCLEQRLIGEKENEITQAADLIESLNIEGAVVTCDALNTQTKLIEKIVQKGADYCVAVKDNQPSLFEHIKAWFRTEQSSLLKDNQSIDSGHGRIESRRIQVLPGSLMEEPIYQDILKKWPGLDDGCMIKLTTETVIKNTGEIRYDERYYISSLHFDEQYIAQLLLKTIRNHWAIESNLHWVLDVTFNQDRMHCRNADYLAGRTALSKLAYNIISKAQANEEMQTGRKSATKPQWLVKFNNVDFAVECLSKITNRK